MRKTFVIIMRPGIHTRPLYYQMLMKLCLVGDLLRSLLVAEILDLLVQLHHSHEDDDDNVEDKRDNAGQEKPEIDDRNGVDTAWQKMLADGNGAWIQLEEVPQGKDLYLSGVNVTPLTGEGAGQTFLLDKIEGDCITIGMCFFIIVAKLNKEIVSLCYVIINRRKPALIYKALGTTTIKCVIADNHIGSGISVKSLCYTRLRICYVFV